MIANSRQQTDTEIIMDTQTEVKQFVLRAVLNVLLTINFSNKVKQIIDEGLKEVQNEELKEKATTTLMRYAMYEYKRQVNFLNVNIMPLIAGMQNKKQINQKYVSAVQDVIKKSIREMKIGEINKGYSQLGNSQAKVSYSQSLYGHSELTARYEERKEMVNNLREKTKLVICDTHSDCSDRCSKWQGKIYSLDGTYGTTEDGKPYQPLENAVNDTTYGLNNGLLGYNCRHKLHPYKVGMKAISVSEKERKREYAITTKQREYERKIRKYKDLALTYKEGFTNPQFNNIQKQFMKGKYQEYSSKAKELNAEYVDFCHRFNRVEYRSRLKI